MSLPAPAASPAVGLASEDERWAAWRQRGRALDQVERRRWQRAGASLALALLLGLGVYTGIL